MQDPTELYSTLKVQFPDAARLAVLSSLPVRVSPAVLRSARLRLLKNCGTGTESDLWLSDLVEARSVAGFCYRAEVRDFLRQQLAAEKGLLDRVWYQVHLHQADWLSPKVRLEEELTWRLLRDRHDPAIDVSWTTVLEEMQQSDNAKGVARWAVRAISNLPPYALESEIATKVWVGAHLILGDASILGEEPQHFIETGEFDFATRRLSRRRIQVGLTPQGLIVSPIRRIENGHEIEIPGTRPLWIQLEDLEGKALRVLTLSGNEHVESELPATELVLRLLDGSAFSLADANYASSQQHFDKSKSLRVQIEYDVELYGAEKKVQLPFVMGVLADLSGQSAEALPPVSERRFIEIDRYNFNQRLKAFMPRVVCQVPNRLAGEGDISVDLTFESMDDFSPAAIVRRVGILDQQLWERTQLIELITYIDGNPAALDQIYQALNNPVLLEDLAERENSGEIEYEKLLQKSNQGGVDMDLAVVTLAKQKLASSVKVSNDVIVTIREMIVEMDRQFSKQLGEILHHSDFQQLEGTWRGLYHLVNNTETDETLKIKVLNIYKKELYEALAKYQGAEWDESPIFKIIYQEEYEQFGGEPYGCLVGDYYFDHNRRDVELLSAMARICAASHTPFIAAASPSVMQMESWQELGNPRELSGIFHSPEYAAWHSLRDSDDAKYIGLTVPRFLSRLPYGAKTQAVEEFDFEEETGSNEHNQYTWSNSAYLMAVNINRAFKTYGWCARIRGMESGGAVEGLPVHTFPTDDGGVDMSCPTEIAISDRREAELARNGFMPLEHRKNSDIAVFIGAQSLQHPPEFDDPDATANANLAARLPYVFAYSRFAQYLKCIVRDKIGMFRETEDMRQWLNKWIHQYVDGDPENSSEVYRASHPLVAAEVVMDEAEMHDGYVNAKLYIQPHYQLEGLTVSLRLEIKLPTPNIA
ncbi:MAG: type VI secretion system contractile sheath large subunit [Candidatus Thiodiazotropha sp.]